MKKTTLLLFLCLYPAVSCPAQGSGTKDGFIELKGGDYPFWEEGIPVTLSPFAISPVETTYGQMEAFALANGLDPKKYHNPKWGEPEREYPAVYVDWFDAVRYADWLSVQSGLPPVYTVYGKKNKVLHPSDIAYWDDESWKGIGMDIGGKGYRLPTEVEWEYAASGYELLRRKQLYAGTDKAADSLGHYAWYYDNSEGRVHQTASLLPNPLGIYDMSGNVLEWCFDVYGWEGFDTFRNQTDPFLQGSGNPFKTSRSTRGGSCYDYNIVCRVQFRGGPFQFTPHASYSTFGFRLCRTL